MAMAEVYKMPQRKPNHSLDEMPEMPPAFYLSSKNFPPVADWRPNRNYKMEIEVRQTSMRMEGKSKETEAHFEILSVKDLTPGTKPVGEQNKLEFRESVSKAKGGEYAGGI